MKKVYKIRDKTTGKFVTLGYNRKQSWLTYPQQAIDNNPHQLTPKENYEVVVFTFVESHTEILK